MTQDKEEETVVPVQQFIDDIIKEELGNPNSNFKERLDVFGRHIFDFEFDPIKFTIMGDSYVAFYKFSDEQERKWLEGGVEEKTQVLKELDELNEPKLIMDRVLNMCNILIFSATVRHDSFYLYVANRLFYILSGEGGFLTDIGLSLYNIPPEKKEQPKGEIRIPQGHGNEGMYQ